MEYNAQFMKEAIKQAKKAESINETPIGAVIVHKGKIIARGYNKRETNKNSLCHAEIMAINKASKKLGGWRLPECDMYVTLEPCPMCAGAIISSRIDNLYFGAYDKKSGCAGSVTDLFKKNLFNHNVNVVGGLMENECADILKNFFKKLRQKKEI
ncbi:MAG: tRNA adenosine(34) deaminase TadA [Clostridia bacterium]|nr:tRNA adenosine(34) deaminase TadA [Clostridia bacterium]